MPREIKEIKNFLLKARRKDTKSVKIKQNYENVKFKIRCPRFLYTLVITDKEKAEKLKQSLTPGLQVKKLKYLARQEDERQVKNPDRSAVSSFMPKAVWSHVCLKMPEIFFAPYRIYSFRTFTIVMFRVVLFEESVEFMQPALLNMDVI